MIVDAAVNMTAGSWIGNSCWWRNTRLNSLASATPSTFAGEINFYLAFTDAPLVVTVADGPAAADLTVSGVIKENTAAGKSGKVIKQGAGTLVLTGANSYTGPTTINEGALQLGNGGTVGKLATTGAITNHATLVFNRSNALTQGTDFSAGAICGSGGVLQAGGGTTTLNAANTFSGAVTVTNGVLRLAQASALTATNDVFIVTASGAKLDLPAAGTTMIRRLYVNGVLKLKDKAYGPANLPAALSGSAGAYLLTTDGETANGTLIRVK
jgi:autotransporter-associated beta strand protein